MIAYSENNDKLKFVGLSLAKPIDELPNPVLDLRLRVITQQRPGLGDVGESLRHVAGLRWLSIDLGALVERGF
jgi:hypothetical protein